jgi:hypothetical protein
MMPARLLARSVHLHNRTVQSTVVKPAHHVDSSAHECAPPPSPEIEDEAGSLSAPLRVQIHNSITRMLCVEEDSI